MPGVLKGGPAGRGFARPYRRGQDLAPWSPIAQVGVPTSSLLAGLLAASTGDPAAPDRHRCQPSCPARANLRAQARRNRQVAAVRDAKLGAQSHDAADGYEDSGLGVASQARRAGVLLRTCDELSCHEGPPVARGPRVRPGLRGSRFCGSAGLNLLDSCLPRDTCPSTPVEDRAAQLLGFEPGGYAKETARKREFAESRTGPRSQWFSTRDTGAADAPARRATSRIVVMPRPRHVEHSGHGPSQDRCSRVTCRSRSSSIPRRCAPVTSGAPAGMCALRPAAPSRSGARTDTHCGCSGGTRGGAHGRPR